MWQAQAQTNATVPAKGGSALAEPVRRFEKRLWGCHRQPVTHTISAALSSVSSQKPTGPGTNKGNHDPLRKPAFRLATVPLSKAALGLPTATCNTHTPSNPLGFWGHYSKFT